MTTKLTVKMVDQWVEQFVAKQTGGQAVTSGPPDIIKSLLDRATGKRNSNNGNAENQT